MDYLIKKSDNSITNLGGTVGRVQLPEMTGGDVIFTGDKRPLDLGDYVLVKATEVLENIDPETQYRGKTIETVDGDNLTVTVTYPAVNFTVEDWSMEIDLDGTDASGSNSGGNILWEWYGNKPMRYVDSRI